MKKHLIPFLVLSLSIAQIGAEETKPSADKPVRPGGPAGPGAPRPDGSFFKSMDKNDDKAISKEEAGERWERLGKADKDGDGKVTMQELMANRPEGGPGSPGRPGGGEFFANSDKNKDGKVSKDEVPAEAWERLGKLDKDGDSAVSREEMAAMMPGRGGPGGPGGGELFAKSDKNGDGKISKDEVPAEAWDRIGRLDKNSDGSITKEEMAAMMQGGPGLGGPQGGPEAVFSRYDADKDGKLSKTEVPAEMWDRLSKADENADGLVSKEELKGVYRPGEGPGRNPENKPGAKPETKRPEAGTTSA